MTMHYDWQWPKFFWRGGWVRGRETLKENPSRSWWNVWSLANVLRLKVQRSSLLLQLLLPPLRLPTLFVFPSSSALLWLAPSSVVLLAFAVVACQHKIGSNRSKSPKMSFSRCQQLGNHNRRPSCDWKSDRGRQIVVPAWARVLLELMVIQAIDGASVIWWRNKWCSETIAEY